MRFYFDISDGLPIRDQVGRDFRLVSDAVVYAKYLAADMRCLEPDIRPQLSIRVIGEGLEPIHQEPVFTQTRADHPGTRRRVEEIEPVLPA